MIIFIYEKVSISLCKLDFKNTLKNSKLKENTFILLVYFNKCNKLIVSLKFMILYLRFYFIIIL